MAGEIDWVARCDTCHWVLLDRRPPRARGPGVYARDCPRCVGTCMQIEDPPQEALMAAYQLGGEDALFEMLPWEDVYRRDQLKDSWEGNTPGAFYRVGGGTALIPLRQIRHRLRKGK